VAPSTELLFLGSGGCIPVPAFFCDCPTCQAVDFWRRTGIPECVVTHCSCHAWRGGQLVQGWTQQQRGAFAEAHPHLRFAHDGMRLRV
jgi:hypothetical protein